MNKLQINGFDIETDTADDRVFINIDKDGKNGGYIQVKFDAEGIVIDVFDADGEVINSIWNFYDDVAPIAEELE
jgi:hypothetical protein